MEHTRTLSLARRSLAPLAFAVVFVLGFAPSFAQDAKLDPEKKFAAIVERMEKAQNDFMDALRAEKDQSKKQEMYEKRPGVEFLGEFKSLAKEAKGSETAAKCWMQVAQIGGDFGQEADFKSAVETLVAEHIQSESIAELPAMVNGMSEMIGPEKVEPILKDLLSKSPHKQVQGGALFELAQRAMGADASATEKRAEGRKLLERLSKDYAGVKSSYGKDFKEMADGFLFELDHLQIGQVAPDFEATDENGAQFKLSDYRGKVVVLDFWGFW